VALQLGTNLDHAIGRRSDRVPPTGQEEDVDIRDMDTPDQPRSGDEATAEISREMLRIHVENFGHGAARVETHIMDGLVVSVLDEIELAPGEETLIRAGRSDLVVNVRKTFQRSMETTFRAAVERATGRNVIAFVSELHLDPNFALEIFRLSDPGVRLEG
jgi:uncharacterized protein YbcI